MFRSVAAVFLAVVLAGCGSAAESRAPATHSSPPRASANPSWAAHGPGHRRADTNARADSLAALDARTRAHDTARRRDSRAAPGRCRPGDRPGAPDMIAAVLTADGAWAGAAGVDGPNGRKARPTDEFGVASVSKMLLAALMFKLAEQGKIDLDAPIATYLEGIDVDANGATVRQAIAMRSGIGTTVEGAIDKALAESSAAVDNGRHRLDHPRAVRGPGDRLQLFEPDLQAARVRGGEGGRHADRRRPPLVRPRAASMRSASSSRARARLPPKPWALPIEGHTSGLDVRDSEPGGPSHASDSRAWQVARRRSPATHRPWRAGVGPCSPGRSSRPRALPR